MLKKNSGKGKGQTSEGFYLHIFEELCESTENKRLNLPLLQLKFGLSSAGVMRYSLLTVRYLRGRFSC